MKTGLYFGSFNPIHIGHLAIANYFVEYTDLNEVWFIISPHNPLKNKNSLLDNKARLELVTTAIDNDPRFKACDIEFDLPQPSYTINTLNFLNQSYPDKTFAIIMGSDGLPMFHKWKDHEEIIKNYKRYIYPRHGESTDYIKSHENIQLVSAPRMELSASFIREALHAQKDICHLLPHGVFQLIKKNRYYF